jgi:nitronate monooxygenase
LGTNFIIYVMTISIRIFDAPAMGFPLPFPCPSLKYGVRLISARAASVICKKWIAKFNYLPDAFVVEGPKAGGHLGFKPEQIDNP